MAALCTTLRDEGFQVGGAKSGEEALALLRSEPFDLVLVDLMMPQMDGIAFLQEALRVDPFLVGIVMTGHASIPTAVEAMRTGAIDYVVKPFKLSLLLPVLERALTVRRLRLENAGLERQVRQRTEELEQLNKDLDAFSYSVSHDLQTPLRTIAGFSEILRGHHGHALSAEALRLVGLIQRGAAEMSQLINDLLGFSRLGRQAVARKNVDLGRLCREVFEELAAERSGRRVELRVQPLPRAQGDPALLRIVFANLLSNAIKYTRPREAALIEVGASGPTAEVAPVYHVRDNGVGFDLQHAGKLFDVFQRLHHAHEFEGTGVGLATARRIIERHGGRIWAEAVPGSGATFFFTLPAVAE